MFSARAMRILAAFGRFGSSSRLGAWSVSQVASRLIAAHRWEEANALFDAVRVNGGENASIATVYASAAQERGLHSEAIARWKQARRLGAKEPLISARLAANFRSLGDLSTAKSILDDAFVHHPQDVRILTEAARLAQVTDRAGDAVVLWRRAIQLAKPHSDWLHGYGLSLMRTGDFDRANRVVASARRRYPQCLDLLALHGWIATGRQDWPQAIEIWTAHCRRSPNETANKEALGSALHGAQMSGGQAAPSIKADIVTLYDEPTRRLLLGFESLGDSCELGLVQRRFGAEPLGLLRWNNVSVENLIAALDHGFKGMGEPDNTTMTTAANGELFLMDRRWDLSMQTFMFADRVDPDDVYKKMCRRIIYLRDKLLDDLKSAEKIFVHRSEVLPSEVLRRLHRALQAHGPVTLLSVQPGHPAGSVNKQGEGLYVGFLARLGSVTDPRNYDIAFETWTHLLTEVLKNERMRSAPATSVETYQTPA